MDVNITTIAYLRVKKSSELGKKHYFNGGFSAQGVGYNLLIRSPLIHQLPSQNIPSGSTSFAYLRHTSATGRRTRRDGQIHPIGCSASWAVADSQGMKGIFIPTIYIVISVPTQTSTIYNLPYKIKQFTIKMQKNGKLPRYMVYTSYIYLYILFMLIFIR